MSRTHVHTKLRFVVPPEDVERYQTSFYTIMNWKHFYNKFYGRYRGEKPYRKMCNRQERAQLRTDVRNMRLDPESFEDYIPPRRHDTLWDLD